MQNPNSPLFLNPHWLERIGAVPDPAAYTVYAVTYGAYDAYGKNSTVRTFKHRTLRAAGRRLGSVIAGKLRGKNDHAAFVVAPDGTLHNWYSANGKSTPAA